MFPYIQNENPITSGNNDLKFIKIYSLKLIPSLSANVPAKITISNPKAIRIISSEDSILEFSLIILFFSNQQVNKSFKHFLSKKFKITNKIYFQGRNKI